MSVLFLMMVAVARAGACEALLKHLDAVARAGDGLRDAVRSGEVTTIGPPTPRNFDWDAISLEDGVANGFAITAPYPVRWLGLVGGTLAHVQLVDGAFERMAVPIFELTVHARPDLQRARLKERFRALASEPMTFRRGERVRVRVDGLMRPGVVIETRAGQLTVDGIAREPGDVFKWVAARPDTVISPRHWGLLELIKPAGLTRLFLNRVARWTSRRDFRALSTKERMRHLAQLTVNMNPWHNSQLTEDRRRDFRFDELLRQGFGVCRHLNPMTAALLNESGYPVRVVTYADHAWTEAQSIDRAGRPTTWVVESSVRPGGLAKVFRFDALHVDPTPFATRYYLQPAREVLYQSPGWVP